MNIYFIRHGITIGNEAEIVNGHSDDPLSPLGVKQACDLGKRLSSISVNALFCSDLSRTVQTTTHIKDYAGWGTEIVLDQRLRERNSGKYEGGPIQVMRNDRLALGMEFDEFCEWSPDIESPTTIVQRWISFYQEMIEGHDHENVVIVSHGGFIRLVFMYYMSLTSKQYFDHYTAIVNCGITKFEFKKDKVLLMMFNG